MPNSLRILAFSGSARRESLNRKLLAVTVQAVRAAGAEVTLLDLNDLALPLSALELTLLFLEVREIALTLGAHANPDDMVDDLFFGHRRRLVRGRRHRSLPSLQPKPCVGW